MRKSCLIFFGLLVVSMFISNAYCEDHEGRYKGRHHQEGMDFFNKASLTPEQKKVLQDYRVQYRKKMDVSRGNLRACREKLHKELENPKPDRAKINEIATQMKQAQAAMLDSRIDAILQMKEIIANMKIKKDKK